MNARLLAAEAAFSEGRRDDALAEFAAVLTEDPAQPQAVYLTLVRQLYQAQRYVEGERWAVQAVARHPEAYELWNIRGVFLRMLGRPSEALAALDRAVELNPADLGARVNRGNVLLDLGDGARAAAAFGALVSEAPDNPVLHHHLGRALDVSGRPDEAVASFRRALAIRPQQVETWLQFARLMNQRQGHAQAESILNEGLAANPDNLQLLEAMGLMLRASGEGDRTLAFLQGLVERHPDAAWLHFHLGDLVAADDRPRGLTHLRRAVTLDPANRDQVIALIQVLERGRGREEAVELEEAYALAKRAVAPGRLTPAHAKVLGDAFGRVCDFEAEDALGDFKILGRGWASAGIHVALLRHMARVTSPADCVELLEQHRIWGETVEARAATAPINRKARGARTKIRLGVMSSDLRRHAVTHFAQPIFDHLDRDRFELYAYSFFQGPEDPVQARIASQVSGFRWRPDIGVRAAAQMIADDGLDMLLELGGSTHMNKLEVMAYRPAPLQGSWLGYPHSAGLSAIDRLVCDPFNAPTDPRLLIEEPLVLPRSWIVLGPAFSDQHLIKADSAEDRQGFITFGTANSPYKYTAAGLRTWASIVASVPNARFAFIRPEAAAPTFRRNVLAAFAREGVPEDRVVFHAVRGAHLPFYNEVDISLDTLPMTGGTTTAESLWMGVPVITLVGEAFFERLGYSILTNAGLGDLCTRDVAQYVHAAVALAADRDRRRDLRATLRQRLRAGPLGQTEAFARDFYDAIADAVERTG